MTPDLTALARALVALPGWGWQEGMLRADPSLPDRTIRCRSSRVAPGWVPDLLDPATGGVLLDMLGPGWSAHHQSRGWLVCCGVSPHAHRGPSLAAACARAMVARGRV